MLTFAQAIRSTKNATTEAICRVKLNRSAALNGFLHRGDSSISLPLFVSGYSASSRFAMPEISACAWARVPPGFNLAKLSTHGIVRSSSL